MPNPCWGSLRYTQRNSREYSCSDHRVFPLVKHALPEDNHCEATFWAFLQGFFGGEILKRAVLRLSPCSLDRTQDLDHKPIGN